MGKQKSAERFMPYAAKNIMKILMIAHVYAYLTSKRATQVFLWVYCMFKQAVSPNIQQLGGVIYFCTR